MVDKTRKHYSADTIGQLHSPTQAESRLNLSKERGGRHEVPLLAKDILVNGSCLEWESQLYLRTLLWRVVIQGKTTH